MKLDYFPFHGEAFRRATIGWPKAKIGAYLALLWHQWNEYSVPADDVGQIARILGESRIQTRKLWDGELAEKFPRWEDGKFRNRRMEAVRERELEAIRRRSDHGRSGALARWGKTKRTKQKPATLWKRAVAIAHAVIDELPDAGVTAWREEFKDRAMRQGIPYNERGGKSNTPLVARAVEWVMGVKQQRVKRGEKPSWGRKQPR